AQILLDEANTQDGFVDSSTIALLQTQLVALAGDGTGPRIQLQLGPARGARTQLLDVVRTIDSAQVDVEQRLNANRAAFEAARPESIAGLEAKLRQVRADYEAA